VQSKVYLNIVILNTPLYTNIDLARARWDIK
jgi:hypothetical protein